MKTSTKLMILAAILALVMVACSSSPRDEVLVKVDGEEITRKDLDNVLKMVQLVTPDVDAMLEDEGFLEYFEDTFLRMLVDNTLIRMELERLDLSVEEAELDEIYDNFRSQLVADLYNSDEELDQRLKELDLTEDVIRGLLFGEVAGNTLFDHLLKDLTDEEVRKYAEENDLLLVAGSVTAYHILVETEEETLEALKRIREGGEEFFQLAEELSLCPSGQNRGELGKIFENDPNWDQDFKDGAFALKAGEISDPVKTQFGWHLILVEEVHESYYKDFEEEKELLRFNREEALINEYFNGLWEKAEIEFLL